MSGAILNLGLQQNESNESISVRISDFQHFSFFITALTMAVSTTESNPTMEADDMLLTQRMRHATKEVHAQSDRLVNLKLSMVLTSKHLYAEAISLFWPIYAELEAILEKHKDHKQLGLLYPILPILRRGSRFEEDMKSLLGGEDLVRALIQRRVTKNEEKRVYSPPELQAYIDHLHDLSNDNPVALVAYVYSMYSAIMAGGAIIKRMVKRAYSIKTEEGVQIFIIDVDANFPNSKTVSNEMKRIINAEMEISEEEKELILKESSQVFVQNNALVATVKDTAIFATATKDCLRFFGSIVVSLLVVLIAILTVYGKK